jgi:hypothetical protein
MGSRSENERKFRSWVDFPTGTRLYSLIVAGRGGWSAQYHKEVDSLEKTIRFWQEIYDESGRLVEVHQKFPVDTGHRKV